MERTSASGGCTEWKVEAKQRLAMWKQQLSMVRALAHGDIVVEVAARKGVKISVDGSGLNECMESSSFQAEAARKLARRDTNMEIAEKVVYSNFLVSAAREAGVRRGRVEVGAYVETWLEARCMSSSECK